jgi:hypothetical protein
MQFHFHHFHQQWVVQKFLPVMLHLHHQKFGLLEYFPQDFLVVVILEAYFLLPL